MVWCATGNGVLPSKTICKDGTSCRNEIKRNGDVVTEIDASLEVLLANHIAVQVSLGPDTAVRCSFHVTGVVHQAGVDLQCGTAVLFCSRDDVVVYQESVKGGVGVVLTHAAVVLFHAVVLHVTDLPVPDIHTGGPVQVVSKAALEIGKDTEHIAAHAVIVHVCKRGGICQ